MKKIALYAATASFIVSGLAGCALAQPRGPNPCNGANCQVHVTVDANCVVSVDHEILRVARGNGPATIVWSIDGGTFARDNGIYIKSKGDPASQVTSIGASGSTWVMVQKRTPNTQIEYGINTLVAARACPPKDPTVANEP